MHGYSPLGRPSPSSPRRLRHGCFKNASVGGVGSFRGGDAKLQRFVERLVYVFISAVYRRRGVLLFAPLLYISGMLLYMGSLGFDVVVVSKVTGGGGKPAPPGSVYRSPQVFEKLWPFMEAENNASSSNAVLCGFSFFLFSFSLGFCGSIHHCET